MPVALSSLLSAVERLWPSAGAEPWDAVGLVAGHPDDEIARVLLAVDATSTTVDEALGIGADLLLVHHPLLLRGVTTIAADDYKGSVLTRLIRGGCALLAAHTNADVVENGTSGTLAARLGLTDVAPLVPSSDPARGLGRRGALPEPTTLGAFAERLAEVVPDTATGIRVAGPADRPVRLVTLCGGAGDSLLADPAVLRSDVYVTSDLRHHPASESLERSVARGAGPALIDVSHWASESVWLESAAADLLSELPGIEVRVSARRTDPWDFVVHP